MSSLRGWPSSDKNADTLAPHVTVEPMSPELHGLTVRAMIAAYNVATDLTEAGSTVKLINATAHVARPGDVIRMISGPAQSDEAKVVAVTPNSIQLATKLSAAPTTGNQFAVFRPRQMQVDDQGNLIVTSTSGPVEFVRDNIDTEVNEDTVTPANSRPLPVKLFYGNGQSDVAEDVTASLALIEGATQATAQDIDALNDNFGAQNAAVATTDTGTFSFMAFVKRMLQKLTSIDTSNAAIAVDTASISASNAQIQAYTNVIATNTTNANILAGAVNETAPATDTASSGLNGRLQRIAQRLTSLIALLPSSIGQNLRADSLSVTLASDQGPLTIASSDTVASGTITTQNLVPAGVATAGSAVLSGALNGVGTCMVQVTGTYTGALSLQVTLDGTNWVTVGGTPFMNAATGAFSATIASATQGIFQFEITGVAQYRIAALAAVTGTATVTVRSSRATGLVSVDGGVLGTVTTITSITNAVPTRSPVNAAGTQVNNTLSGTTASPHAAPANAVGFIFEHDSTSSDSVRWSVGSTASATVGNLCEPGRDTGFVPIGTGATISVAAVASTGTNSYSIQWVRSS